MAVYFYLLQLVIGIFCCFIWFSIAVTLDRLDWADVFVLVISATNACLGTAGVLVSVV